MFTKVLIADDIDFNDVGASKILKELEVPFIDYTKYCDDALLKIKKAAQDNDPYQLLITDLSFKSDEKVNILNSGQALIRAVKVLFPELKIIAFSIEDRPHKIKELFDELKVDGYVLKGRKTIEELTVAVQKAFDNEKENISPELFSILQDKSTTEINQYDLVILQKLSIGISQEAMEGIFKQEGISPNSKSSIEKHINKLKIYLKANNTTHLVAIAKDLGII